MLFVLMNSAAIAVLAVKRDYGLVNRWTSRLLAANLLLLGTDSASPWRPPLPGRLCKPLRRSRRACNASRRTTPRLRLPDTHN
ncbi:MAG: hypothetical protein U0163_13965 [Gemmatimonadaceae bacterium]